MKLVGLAILIFASLSCAQSSGDFQPSTTNVWGADYPRVDSTGRVQVRVKAPNATKVKLNFWSGPKLDMEKQPDGFWAVTTPPLVPGFHYYTLIIDGAEVADPKAIPPCPQNSPTKNLMRWSIGSHICFLAFAPIHQSFENLLGTDLFRLVYSDWNASHERLLR